MRSFRIHLQDRSYRVVVGRRLLERLPSFLGKLGFSRRAAILTEPEVARFCLKRVEKSFRKAGLACDCLLLPRGERAKSESTLFKIYEFLLGRHYERQEPVVALGGGTVGDVAGFAASTYLRGLPLVQVGTTLLAQVDSSLGGKTGINLSRGKNLVGTFYQPRLVVSDVTVLQSLPKRDRIASLAEVVKYGVIRDPGLFEFLEEHVDSILQGDPTALETVVFRSARIKAAVVERDEQETRGERMILNYGHTWGHAFEAALGFRSMRHGEAVALGMVCAARLAAERGLLDLREEVRQRRLLERVGLPTRLGGWNLSSERVIQAMALDKKRKKGRLRFVLPRGIGRVRIVDDVSLEEVKRILEEVR